MTNYRFDPARSRARVIADAPGHRFRAEASGLEGEVAFDAETLTSLDARFPLEGLDAGDPLGNRELRKFLDLRSRPVARATLTEPIPLNTDPTGRLSAQGPIEISIGTRRMQTRMQAQGHPESGQAGFRLTFTGLGYKPPKLLFFKVKDQLEIEVEVVLQTVQPPIVD